MVYFSEIPAMPFEVPDILAATNGSLLAGTQDAVFKSISIDSRKISGQEIFLAIKGAMHDGHNFIADVMQKDGIGVIAKTGVLEKLLKNVPPGNVIIGVEDTLKALSSLARYQLDRSGCSVVAITGTNGKTTTKELTALVLEEAYPTHATTGNFNNHIGLPLTMLGLSQRHAWAVFELGMNHKGEIAALTQLCHPSMGVITNVGQAHLSGLGSVENIAAAKGELLAEMDHDHVAVLNMDDPFSIGLAAKYNASTKRSRLIGFGFTNKAAVRAENLERTASGIAFTLVMPGGQKRVHIKAPGLYMVSNALAAAAVGYAANMTIGSIVKGLEKFTPVSGRMEVKETAKGFRIMNDTYNANPSSMKAAIETLEARQGRRGFVVLGEMLELGPQAPAMHEEIGRRVAQNKMFSLFTYGAHGKDYLNGARKEGMSEETMFTGEKADILRRLYAEVGPGDVILVKGSRGTRMEDVVNHLIEWGDA